MEVVEEDGLAQFRWVVGLQRLLEVMEVEEDGQVQFQWPVGLQLVVVPVVMEATMVVWKVVMEVIVAGKVVMDRVLMVMEVMDLGRQQQWVILTWGAILELGLNQA
jgi:hypothetical protein